jgi:hypothetical protein
VQCESAEPHRFQNCLASSAACEATSESCRVADEVIEQASGCPLASSWRPLSCPGLGIVTGCARPCGAFRIWRMQCPSSSMPPHGRCLAALSRILPSISRLRERNCLPFTLNGLDVTTGAASNYSMGQSYSSGRCEHCRSVMVLIDSKGPRALRCLECDQIDPMELPSITAWLVGELRPPK